MGRAGTPVTPAVRALRAAGVSFTAHLHDYEERGGTAVSARELGVDEHGVVKTLVMEDARRRPLVVLMHGDTQVSRKEPALGVGCEGCASLQSGRGGEAFRVQGSRHVEAE
jgi:prolyl-tRNA editing enzyme YbaK/EbsC (Cys-tRNA(Pro) deacylase)